MIRTGAMTYRVPSFVSNLGITDSEWNTWRTMRGDSYVNNYLRNLSRMSLPSLAGTIRGEISPQYGESPIAPPMQRSTSNPYQSVQRKAIAPSYAIQPVQPERQMVPAQQNQPAIAPYRQPVGGSPAGQSYGGTVKTWAELGQQNPSVELNRRAAEQMARDMEQRRQAEQYNPRNLESDRQLQGYQSAINQQGQMMNAARRGVDVPGWVTQSAAIDPAAVTKYVNAIEGLRGQQQIESNRASDYARRQSEEAQKGNLDDINTALNETIRRIRERYASMGRTGSSEEMRDIQQAEMMAAKARAGEPYRNPYLYFD